VNMTTQRQAGKHHYDYRDYCDQHVQNEQYIQTGCPVIVIGIFDAVSTFGLADCLESLRSKHCTLGTDR
jgi:hypothetical protein